MATSPNDMRKNFPVIPHHEIRETFADTLGSLFFDGQTLRLDFAVSRMSELKPPATTPTGERHVVARLALSLSCATDLINQMQMLAAQLNQSNPKTGETDPKLKSN